MKTALLNVVGASTAYLAQYLNQNHEWHIDQVVQVTSMRGMIAGRHENPEQFEGVGINDGTRIMNVVVNEEPHAEPTPE